MLLVIATFALPLILGPCFGLGTDADLEVIRPFGPVGRYAGHWGTDLSAPSGAPVRSIGDGVVSYSGVIAGRQSVTVEHGSSVKSSYSYLAERLVRRGTTVTRGQPIGVSGMHGGYESFHLSLRVDNTYVDPMHALRCNRISSRALYLATPIQPYALGGVRNSRRNIRPTPRGSPVGGARRI